jgi:hypothetical protein
LPAAFLLEKHMNESRHTSVSTWVEIVATIGVILSMLFVGYEIRQNTAVSRGQARQELATLNQEWLLTLGQDAEYEALWYSWSPQAEKTSVTLTEAESRRAWFVMTLHLRRLENVYFQYREGLVDESALESYGFAAAGIFRTTAFRVYWIDQNTRAGFDPDFVAFLEQRIAMATAGPASGSEPVTN